METLKMEIVSAETASRLELFVRIIWGAIVGFVLGLVGIFISLVLVAQWLHILILGRRQPSMQKLINAYGVSMAQLKFYMLLSTDERPPAFPKF